MAIATDCQTPGAVFSTRVTKDRVEAMVEFPVPMFLTREMAIELEANIHNALELVLARYFHTSRGTT